DLEYEHFETLQNSGLLDSLYESLTLKERARAFYRNLSPVVKGRIRALKRIQYESLKLEVEFYKELAKLELQFTEKQQKLFEQRQAIVTGEYEPTLGETDWEFSEDDEMSLNTNLGRSGNEGDAPVNVSPQSVDKSTTRGIPGFWLMVLKHAPLICDTIRPTDIPALKYLKDIRSIPIESNERPGFQLEFEFEPNEYFTNTVLTKRYFMNFDLKEDNPLSYDGPEVVATEGKFNNEKQVVTKSTNIESFFHFFNPPEQTSAPKGSNPTLERRLLEDFDLGQYLKERVIPRAVAYFTGETLDLENEVEDPDDFSEDEFLDESEEDLNG
ncbi:Nucleosome assembly protein, partial [Paragonimus heterotremus]